METVSLRRFHDGRIKGDCWDVVLQDLPKYMQLGLFSRLHDRRLCDLFAPKNATGFVGTCQNLPAKCSQVTTRPLIDLNI